MGRTKPFGIAEASRTDITQAIRRVGVNSFGTKGYFREYFNQNMFEVGQEHVLGTSAQVANDDATIHYDDTAGVFKDKAGGTVTLLDLERVGVVVDTAGDDIDFPSAKEIVFVPYDAIDLDSNTLNLPGTYSGELRADNGTIVLNGTSHGLRINGTAIVDTSSMTAGTVIVNGILLRASIKVQWSFPQLIGSGLTITGAGVPALAVLNNTDVAYFDDGIGELRTYRFNGLTWSLVGSGLAIGPISTPALAALNSTDVAFIADTQEELRTYRFNGSVWALVGSGLGISGIANPALAALTGTDVAFVDADLEELRTYRFGGSTWSLVGSGLSFADITTPALAALNSTDVAFTDDDSDELRTYRFNGSTWNLVGSGLPISGGIGVPALASLNGTDVVFITATLENLETYRFNGSTWSQVGSGLAISGIGQPALAAINGVDVIFIDQTLESLRTYRFGFSIESPYRPF